ncbi:hypothetical protein N7456_012361 [Penicillium angulare]|uniref:Uncharacterized protein n=1 Tax=Penicillium angulare TaxID=116970 RepID=A0A9W9EVR9_9EURO|nr:hypothetical protein N7456_012361 [Penicillium angulare]
MTPPPPPPPAYRWGLNMIPFLTDMHPAKVSFDFDTWNKNIKVLDRITKTDDYIAPYIGEQLPYQVEAQKIHQDLFDEELPQVISNGKPVDAVYLPSWSQLVQKVPTEEWKVVKTDGHVDPHDPTYYRCRLDDQMIQVTQKQMKAIGWLQENYSKNLNAVQRKSMSADKQVAERLATSLKQLSEDSAIIASTIMARCRVYEKDLGSYFWSGNIPGDSVNSNLFHSGGDVPYRSPQSHTGEEEEVGVAGDIGEEEENDEEEEEQEEEQEEENGEEQEEGEREGGEDEEVNEDENSDDGYSEGETEMVNPHEQTRRSSSRIRRPSSRARLNDEDNALEDEPPHKRARIKRRRSSQASRISDIPLATKRDILEFTKSEAKHAYKFLKDRQDRKLNWTQIEQEYCEEFEVDRSQQWLRSYVNKINQYLSAHPDAIKRISPRNPGYTEEISFAHQIYLECQKK